MNYDDVIGLKIFVFDSFEYHQLPLHNKTIIITISYNEKISINLNIFI